MDIYKLPQEVIDFKLKYSLDIKAFNELNLSFPVHIAKELNTSLESMINHFEGTALDKAAIKELVLNPQGITFPLEAIQYQIENDQVVRKFIKTDDMYLNLANEIREHFINNELEHLYCNLEIEEHRNNNLNTVLYINSFPVEVQNQIIEYCGLTPPEHLDFQDYDDLEDNPFEQQRYDTDFDWYSRVLEDYEQRLTSLKEVLDLYAVDTNKIHSFHQGIEQLVTVFQNKHFEYVKEIDISQTRELSEIEIKVEGLIRNLTALEQEGYKEIAYNITTEKYSSYTDEPYASPVISNLDHYILNKVTGYFDNKTKKDIVAENTTNSVDDIIEYSYYSYTSISELKLNLKSHDIFKESQNYEEQFTLDRSVKSVEDFLIKLKVSENKYLESNLLTVKEQKVNEIIIYLDKFQKQGYNTVSFSSKELIFNSEVETEETLTIEQLKRDIITQYSFLTNLSGNESENLSILAIETFLNKLKRAEALISEKQQQKEPSVELEEISLKRKR